MRRVNDFLASRCSKDFLAQYIQEHPGILDRVADPGLMLSAVSEVDLTIRLHEFGLLPETSREAFVKNVISYCIDGEDLYALESLRIQSVFTAADLSASRGRVRAELVPKLGDVRREWEINCGSDQRADAHMGPLLDSFSALKEEFADDAGILNDIAREIEMAEEWIAEKMADGPKQDRPARSFGDVASSDQPPAQGRGVFDDVDE